MSTSAAESYGGVESTHTVHYEASCS